MSIYSKCTLANGKNTLSNGWTAGNTTDAVKQAWYNKLIYFEQDTGIMTFWFFTDEIDRNKPDSDRIKFIEEKTKLTLQSLNDYLPNSISFSFRGSRGGFIALIRAMPAVLANQQLFEDNASPTAPKPSVVKKSASTGSTSATKKNKKTAAPSTRNMSYESGEDLVSFYRIGDLRLLTTTASLALKDAQRRLNYFGITLDKPINLNYHAESVQTFPSIVKTILDNASIKFNDNDYIKVIFDKENYKFKKFAFIKAGTDGAPLKNGQGITDSSSYNFFRDSTTNSVIYNLARIYNKYNKSISREANDITSQTSIFFSSDTVRVFLNKYLYPRTSIASSEITRDLVEKFIIGDIRILDDDLRKRFFIDSSQIPDALRGKLQKEVSKQYEQIGDALGDAWISGKFERIEDVDDIFEQLLNYISIPDLLSLSAKCLLKLIPLDELLDYLCQPVLKEFDKHKEAIIQALDEMDDGIAKDLATELKDIYFNRLLDEQLQKNVAEGIIGEGLKKTPSLVQDSQTLLSWLTKTGVSLFHTNLSDNFGLVKDHVDEFKYAPKKLGDFENVKTIPYSGLKQRLETVNKRIEELQKEQAKLEQQVSVFNNNIPQNLQDLLTYYNTEIPKQTLKKNNIEQAITNGERQIKIYELLLETVIPNLIILDPYLTNEEKNALFSDKNYTAFSYNGDTNQKEQNSATQLNLVSLDGFDNDVDPFFNFSTGAPQYSGKSLRQKKNDFNFNLQNGLKRIVDELQRLQSETNSPFNILNSLEKFGVGALDAYFFDPQEGVFSDPTKRYYLCLAIYSAIPAVGYAIYLLVDNTEDVADFLEDQGKAIYEALKKKLEIFGRVDYPFLDIIGEFVDSLIQIGLNFGRDLLINGIMYVISETVKACSDQERVNAPYNPTGAIDLSGYMASSTNKGSDTAAGDSTDTITYKEILSKDKLMTASLFDTILSKLSETFSINEIASLLDETARDSLYVKAINALDSLTPTPLSKESAFYKYYVNEAGIRELFDIISKSIDPALIVNFQHDYNKQKQVLLDICFGYDDSALGSLFEGLDDDAIREALAANYASKVEVVEEIVEKAIGPLLGENIAPDPCEAGIKYFTDAEKFTLKTVASSIFESLNKSTEVAVDMSKKAFLNTRRGLSNYGSLSPDYGEASVDFYSVYGNPENEQIFNDFTKQNKVAGLENYKQILQLSEDLKLDYATFENNRQVVSLNYQNIPVKQTIQFRFDSADNQINFAYSNLKNKNKNELEPFVDIASYQERNYFAKRQLQREDLEGPGILDSDLNLITSPEYILFNTSDGVITQPEYSSFIKESIGDILYYEKIQSEDIYSVLLNSIFKDMLLYPFKTGLYFLENFNKLNLNKLITTDLQQIQSGQLTDKCFLGFMDNSVLTTQTLNLAERIACYAKDSPTIAPSNVALLKVSFDAFIRSIALQEMMKSFFVIGLFPKDLVFDTISPTSNSIYEQIIKINTIKAVESAVTGGRTSYEKFYDDVFVRFITDITRIIFQNNDITDTQAFNFVVNSQIQFIKDQFKKAYENGFGVNTTTIFGTTEYQLLKEQTSFADLDDTVNDALLDVNDAQFTYSEKLRAIQNDGMATFYQGVIDSVRDFDARSYLDSNEEQKILIAQDKDEATPYKIPFYRLENNEEKEYFDNEDFLFKSSALLDKLTFGNDKGFVLQKYIEIKPNATIMSNTFDPEVKNTIEQFLLKASAMLEPSGFKEQKIYRKKLKLLFYESKLFMMFPQAIDFIHSLDDFSPAPPFTDSVLWKYYYDFRRITKPTIGPYSPEPEHEVDKVNFDLFYWIFKLNYDKPEEFFANEKSMEWYQFIKTADNGELFKKINLSLNGKIKLNDFTHLLNKYIYHEYTDETGGFNIVDSPWGGPFSKDFLSEEDISLEPGQLLNNADFGSYLNSLYLKNSKTRISEFFEFLSFENIYGTQNNGGYSGYAGIDMKIVEDFYDFLQDKIKDPQEYFDNLSFFEWLYTQKTYKILDVQTVIRIETKIPEPKEESSNIPKFTLSGELSSKIFNDTDSEQIHDQRQLELLKEKIGVEEIASEDGSKYLFSAPIYELKQRIPTLSWLEFFVAIDKKSYLNESFYKLDENPNNNLKLNDLLFSNDTKDIFSYYQKLKAFSDPEQKEITTIKLSRYYSTFWWNINGKVFTLSELLDKIYTAGTIDGISIYDILTQESLESFYKEDYVPEENYSDENDTYYPSYLDDDLKKIKVSGERLFIKSMADNGDLPPEEYTAIVKQVLKAASVKNAPTENSGEDLDPSIKKTMNLLRGAIDPKGDFFPNVQPYIQLNENFDWGWPYYGGSFEFQDFSTAQNTKEPLPPSPINYQDTLMEEFVGTVYAPGFNFDFRTPKRQPIGCTQNPRTHEDSIREINFIQEGKGIWVTDQEIEVYKETKETVWDSSQGFFGAFVEKTKIELESTIFYTGWIFPKSGYDEIDFANTDSYYLALNTTKNGLTFLAYKGDSWPSGKSLPLFPHDQKALKADGGKSSLSMYPDPPSVGGYDADGQPQATYTVRITSKKIPTVLHNVGGDFAYVKQRFMKVKFGCVKGGLGAETQQILTKEIPGQFPSVYDLFSVMIKSESDKEAFVDFLNCFFIKEQTTIIALLHRIMTEEHYPQIERMFRRPIYNALANIRSTVGALTGDYQEDNEPSNFEKIDMFLDGAGEFGLDLLKSFLRATASTVDPTWRTPWFLPGPLTPFGVAAKLLDEDFDKEKTKAGTPKKQATLICADSFKASAEFFDNYTKVYEQVLGPKEANKNSDNEPDSN
tara:strand:+ start:2201 stop:10513 length:8313 start_codon:yes stop_codon:yes gene_type:complete